MATAPGLRGESSDSASPRGLDEAACPALRRLVSHKEFDGDRRLSGWRTIRPCWKMAGSTALLRTRTSPAPACISTASYDRRYSGRMPAILVTRPGIAGCRQQRESREVAAGLSKPPLRSRPPRDMNPSWPTASPSPVPLSGAATTSRIPSAGSATCRIDRRRPRRRLAVVKSKGLDWSQITRGLSARLARQPAGRHRRELENGVAS